MKDNILYKRVGLFNKPVCRQCGTVFKFSELQDLDKTTGLCRRCMIKAKQTATGASMEIKPYKDSGQIIIGAVEGDVILPEDLELEACERVKALLAADFDEAAFSVSKKSKDYTTLVYKEYDVMRIKISDRSRWIAVYVSGQDRKKYMDDPLFAKQLNKKEFAWKSEISNLEDLAKFERFFTKQCETADWWEAKQKEVKK